MVYGTLYNGDPCPGRVFSSTVYKLLIWWTWADSGYTVTAPESLFDRRRGGIELFLGMSITERISTYDSRAPQ